MLTYRFTQAITRTPGADFAQGLTTSSLGPPNYALMLHQHAAYVDVLRSLGLLVTILPALPGYPDAYFVEDPAIVVPEAAIITHPGAPSRRGEADAIMPALTPHRPVQRIQPPGTLDGGDVLIIGKRAFIGISERTNSQGAEQLGRILEQHGYTWTGVPVGAGLHLKSSVNYVGNNILLISQSFAGRSEFTDYRQIVLGPGEEYACNTLLINETLITPQGFPSVYQELAALDRRVIELDASEARKMDGGLTCMSLRF
ncbi:MAG: arginine deiminase family protein [Chloroflexota bacterium]